MTRQPGIDRTAMRTAREDLPGTLGVAVMARSPGSPRFTINGKTQAYTVPAHGRIHKECVTSQNGVSRGPWPGR